MQNQRLMGPGSGAEKYDLITALAVNGLAAGGAKQTSMMRLIALVTARYNWAADEVTIGQREMAQLWGVDERTAKRETRRLIEYGLVEIKRPGIRGRVAAYRLNRERVYSQTAADWGNVGPDFDARMSARVEPKPEAPKPKVVHLDFVQRKPADTPWEKVMARLALDQPQHFDAWFSQLSAEPPDEEGHLPILAPTKFIANYVSSRLITSLERAVLIAYDRPLRCKIRARA